MSFADSLFDAVKRKNSCLCMGLDPRPENFPKEFSRDAEGIVGFNKEVIGLVKGLVSIVKPQSAFYEAFGPRGATAFQETVAYAKKNGLLVLVDAKRGDIGSTAKAYAKAFFETYGVDALTVSPYLGLDGVKPFLEYCGEDKGVFILVKTSNPSSSDLQDLESQGRKVYEIMGSLVNEWGKEYVGESCFSSVGAVVGATYPKEAEALRKIMPANFFLVPGLGAQGGTAEDVKPAFNRGGTGAIVNSSRGITQCFSPDDSEWRVKVVEAAKKSVKDLNGVRFG